MDTQKPHTPTIAEARERYIDGFPIDTWVVARDDVGQEFDRLVAHIRAEALREAAEAWRRDNDIVVSTWLERRADREEQGA